MSVGVKNTESILHVFPSLAVPPPIVLRASRLPGGMPAKAAIQMLPPA
jgi:hypothetical protein